MPCARGGFGASGVVVFLVAEHRGVPRVPGWRHAHPDVGYVLPASIGTARFLPTGRAVVLVLAVLICSLPSLLPKTGVLIHLVHTQAVGGLVASTQPPMDVRERHAARRR
ncbi:unnamed protein product [Ectocarpus sp. 8 AP-2014]